MRRKLALKDSGIHFANALRTTRSTFACLAKGGSASLLAKAFGAPKTMPKSIAEGARFSPQSIARTKSQAAKPRLLCQRLAKVLRPRRLSAAMLNKCGFAAQFNILPKRGHIRCTDL